MKYFPLNPQRLALPKPSLNREQWLSGCVEAFRPWFVDAAQSLHTPLLPSYLHVSCGWPSEHALSRSARVIGQCFITGVSKGRVNEIFISPWLDNPVDVAATLLHECIHAADNCQHGHSQKVFGQLARHFGLDGELTSTHPSDELVVRLNCIARQLGSYPHSTLDAAQLGLPPLDPSKIKFRCPKPGRIRKQSTRLLKLACPECGYTIRTTSKWVAVGLPTCVCGAEFGVSE